MTSAQDLVDTRRLESVPADDATAKAMLAEARRHITAAEKILGEDPNGAYQLLYDAARKAVTAHMLASGFRPLNRPGAHEAVARYGETEVGGGPLAELDRMRRNRNRSEYGTRPFGEREVRTDLGHAEGIVEAVTRAWP